MLKGKWGFINKKGKTVIPFKYSFVGKYAYGRIAAKFKGKMGYLDGKGKVVIPFKYERTYNFQQVISTETEKLLLLLNMMNSLLLMKVCLLLC